MHALPLLTTTDSSEPQHRWRRARRTQRSERGSCGTPVVSLVTFVVKHRRKLTGPSTHTKPGRAWLSSGYRDRHHDERAQGPHRDRRLDRPPREGTCPDRSCGQRVAACATTVVGAPHCGGGYLGLAVEAERAGFDEIQFDYIRFPDEAPSAPPTRPAVAHWADAVSPMICPPQYVEREIKEDPYGPSTGGPRCDGPGLCADPPVAQGVRDGHSAWDGPQRRHCCSDPGRGSGHGRWPPVLEPAFRLHVALAGARRAVAVGCVTSITCSCPPSRPRMTQV